MSPRFFLTLWNLRNGTAEVDFNWLGASSQFHIADVQFFCQMSASPQGAANKEDFIIGPLCLD
jgi:hypothetical protein